MNKNIQHSLIIPIFNEKKGIENTLKDLEVFSEDSFEVILVDDGSTMVQQKFYLIIKI